MLALKYKMYTAERSLNGRSAFFVYRGVFPFDYAFEG